MMVFPEIVGREKLFWKTIIEKLWNERSSPDEIIAVSEFENNFNVVKTKVFTIPKNVSQFENPMILLSITSH